MSNAPLQGIKVVELGVWVAGPAVGGLLSDWGADVIKVEPETGDPQRAVFGALGVADQAGVVAQITGIFAQAVISIDAVLQREAGEGENQTDLIILTHDCVEAKMNQALAHMQQLSTVLAPITRIRKEELN